MSSIAVKARKRLLRGHRMLVERGAAVGRFFESPTKAKCLSEEGDGTVKNILDEFFF